MVNWRALFGRPPKPSAASHLPSPTPQLVSTAATSQADRVPEVSPTTKEVNPQLSSPQAKTQNAPNKVSATVGNGLKLSLALLKEAVTGIGVPGLEAAVSGVVKIIEIIENVRDNERVLTNLSDRITNIAHAVSKAPNLHPKEELPKALKLRLEEFLKELQVLLEKTQVILQDRNLLLRTANSQANRDAITEINIGIDRLIGQFSVEGIVSIELNVAGARQDVRAVKEAQDVQEYEVLIERIPRVHARYHDTSTKPSRPCHQGTRIGLLQGINQWIQGPSEDAPSDDGPSDTAYLWLCGEVGVGKTTVAHTIAKEQDGLKQLGASFFFSRHDRDRQSPHLLFPSIAYQLARFDRGIWRALAEVLKPDPDIVNRGLTEQFTKLVLEPLSRSGMASSRTVVIVIDGLDECSNPASVLDALATGIENVSVHLRVLVCSRPYAAIQSKFKNTPLYHLASQNHFHDINPETLSSDVAAFLTWSLGEIATRPANSHLPTPWPAKDQLDELIDRARGLFIIASTYEKYIDDPIEDNPASQLNRILSRKRIVGASPLAELDALYDQALDDLKCSLKTAPELAFARETVEVVILAEGSMSLDTLAGLFSVEPSDVRSILRRLTAVILLPEDQEEAITPFHASFGEYIQDDTRCTIRELSVDTSPAHGRIADRCFASLVSAARNGIIGVEEFQPASVRYASVYFAPHFAASHDRAVQDRKAAMGNGIWTWMNLQYPYSLENIRRNVLATGFKELLQIEGVDADAETDISIARLMIADHALAINATPDKSLELGTSETECAELAVGTGVSKRVQVVKFAIPDADELSRACTVLDILRDVRMWNKYNQPDLFIEGTMVDVNSPTEVQLLVSSSINLRGICSLSDYMDRIEHPDITSKIQLALKVAKAIGNVHHTPSFLAHGFLAADRIFVSAEGNLIIQPWTWRLAVSSATSQDGGSVDCLMTRSADWDINDYWYTPGEFSRSLREKQFEDIWDFGSLLFWIMTGTQPLTRYKRLAEGHPTLGYGEEEKTVPTAYWSGSSKDHEYQARYERAASLLMKMVEGCEEVKTVLKGCWTFRRQDRPSMREVVQQLEAILASRDDL